MFTQMPNRPFRVDYINKNFDRVMFNPAKLDLETLNEYDAIWMYIISGAFKNLYAEKPYWLKWWQFPQWLREQGVTNPKIVFQADYWAGQRNDFLSSYNSMLDHVDGVIHATNREWKIKVPVFYQQFPIKVFPTEWVPFEKKIKRATAIRRVYGGAGQIRKKAEEYGAELIS